jgi:hypothetical protein
MDGDLDGFTEPSQSFIDGVINNLLDKVMKTSNASITYVHSRSFSDGV